MIWTNLSNNFTHQIAILSDVSSQTVSKHLKNSIQMQYCVVYVILESLIRFLLESWGISIDVISSNSSRSSSKLSSIFMPGKNLLREKVKRISSSILEHLYSNMHPISSQIDKFYWVIRRYSLNSQLSTLLKRWQRKSVRWEYNAQTRSRKCMWTQYFEAKSKTCSRLWQYSKDIWRRLSKRWDNRFWAGNALLFKRLLRSFFWKGEFRNTDKLEQRQ